MYDWYAQWRASAGGEGDKQAGRMLDPSGNWKWWRHTCCSLVKIQNLSLAPNFFLCTRRRSNNWRFSVLTKCKTFVLELKLWPLSIHFLVTPMYMGVDVIISHSAFAGGNCFRANFVFFLFKGGQGELLVVVSQAVRRSIRACAALFKEIHHFWLCLSLDTFICQLIDLRSSPCRRQSQLYTETLTTCTQFLIKSNLFLASERAN